MWNGFCAPGCEPRRIRLEIGIARGLVRQHFQRDIVGLRQRRHPAIDRVVQLDLVLVHKFHEQRAHVSEGDRSVGEVHRRSRGHAGDRFAECLARDGLVVLRDLDDHRPEVLGLHRLLNHRCDG